MYDEKDPLLAKLRDLCERFPESVEVEAWGRPTFRAGKKIYSVYGTGDDERPALVFKPDADERPALVRDKRIYIPPYFGPSGWLGLYLTGRVDWTEVAELVDSSYRQVALKRMLKALGQQ